MRGYTASTPVALLLMLLLYSPQAAAQRAETREADTDSTEAAAGGGARVAAAGGAALSPALNEVESRIVELTNAFRSKERRQAVRPAKELKAAAQYFADYMARTGRYGHTADGNQPSGRAERHGYDFCLVSENIAYAYDSGGFSTEELAKQFTQGWINSPGHRKNMLEPDVVDTGVAVARSQSGTYYAVQMFGRPKSMQVQFKVTNRSGQPASYALGDERYELPPRVTRTHTRCRPSELSIHLTGDTKQTDLLNPKDGDTFVVTAADGKVQLQKQKTPEQ